MFSRSTARQEAWLGGEWPEVNSISVVSMRQCKGNVGVCLKCQSQIANCSCWCLLCVWILEDDWTRTHVIRCWENSPQLQHQFGKLEGFSTSVSVVLYGSMLSRFSLEQFLGVPKGENWKCERVCVQEQSGRRESCDKEMPEWLLKV